MRIFGIPKTAEIWCELVEEVLERAEVLRCNEVELVGKENEMTKTELELIKKTEMTEERNMAVVNVLVYAEYSAEYIFHFVQIITRKWNIWESPTFFYVLGSVGKRLSSCKRPNTQLTRYSMYVWAGSLVGFLYLYLSVQRNSYLVPHFASSTYTFPADITGQEYTVHSSFTELYIIIISL